MKDQNLHFGFIVTSAVAAGCGAPQTRTETSPDGWSPSTDDAAITAPAAIDPAPLEQPADDSATPTTERRIPVRRIDFELGSATLEQSDRDTLADVAVQLHRQPRARIHIDGLVAAGTDAELGERRAWRVARCLEELGVLGQQLEVETIDDRRAATLGLEGSSSWQVVISLSVSPSVPGRHSPATGHSRERYGEGSSAPVEMVHRYSGSTAGGHFGMSLN